MKRAARGFTLLELLVVISILAVLAGILTVGIGAVSRAVKKKTTVATLENARSMLAEYELTSRLPKAFDVGYSPTAAELTAKTTEFTNAGLPAPYSTGIVTVPDTTVTIDSESAPATDRRLQTAVFNTAQVFKRLRAVPKNETSFGGLDASKLLPITTGGVADLLDGWGNPVVYAHRSLGGISLGYNSGDKSLAASYSTPYNASDPNTLVTAPDGKPFFASAGPDGDFRTGDDNVYSFEVN